MRIHIEGTTGAAPDAGPTPIESAAAPQSAPSSQPGTRGIHKPRLSLRISFDGVGTTELYGAQAGLEGDTRAICLDVTLKGYFQ